MWSVKCMARSGIKGCHFLLTGAKTIPVDEEDETE